MTILYSNNFDAETTGVLPAGWTEKIGTWVVGTLNPVSGTKTFAPSTNADGNVVHYSAAAAAADMQIDTQQIAVAEGSKFPLFGHVLRSNSANTVHYAVVISSANGTTCEVAIYTKNTTYAAIGPAATGLPFVVAAGQTVFLRTKIVGSTISVYLGAGSLPTTPIRTLTDATISAAGYPGLYYAKDATAITMAVDNFVLDDTTAGAAATAITLAGPTSGPVGSASSSFTVGANGAITGTVTVTPSDGGAGGAFTPSTVAITSATPTATFTYTPSSVGAKTISVTNDGGLTNPSSIVYTASVSTAKPANDAGIVYSPYNWLVNSSSAKTINAGAYFKTKFSGTSCTLNFDITNTSTPRPRLRIKVDGRTDQSATVAATIAVTMPTGQDNSVHLLEVWVDAATETLNRWASPQNTAVVLTSITLASGSDTLAAPTVKGKRLLVYGDSITEGVRTLALSGTADLDRNSATVGWALALGNLLGAETGCVGFGASGINIGGAGGVPALNNSYANLWAGQARDFSAAPDYCVWLEGTNDGTNNTQTNGIAALNGMLTAMPGTKFYLALPLNGTSQATNLQAIAAGCSDPTRVRYIDTAGFWSSTDASDALHPYGYTNLADIAPKLAAAIRRTTKTARTLSLVLTTDGTTPAAGLTGLKWSFFDSVQAHVMGEPASQGSGATTNGAGVLALTLQSTLASGGTGWLVVTNSDGTTTQSPASKAFSGPVQVS